MRLWMKPALRTWHILRRAAGFRLNASAFMAAVVVISFVPFAIFEAVPRYMVHVILEHGSRDDYLASLRGSNDVGCQTLPSVKPDIVIYGDSHVYADIDYVMLGQAWGKNRIGSCPLPGGYVSSFQTFARYLAKFSWKPKVIVYITDFRQMRFAGSKEAMIAKHETILFDDMLHSTHRREWTEAYLDGRPPFGRSAAGIEAWKKQNREPIKALSDDLIARTLEKNVHRYLSVWKYNMKINKMATDIDHQIHAFCERINELGSRLYIVQVPDSPWLDAMIDPDQYKVFLQKLKSFDCAEKIVVGSVESWGIKNNDFVNRQMRPNVDYSNFDGKTHPDIDDWHYYFDADHMNPFGAEVVTRQIIKSLPAIGEMR